MLPSNSKIQINLTSAAASQISLIQANDYTLEGMSFRLKIDGKGCEGFTYATGFSLPLNDDIKLAYIAENIEITLLIDPFTAHYCSNGELDYAFSRDGEDGFIFTNNKENLYHGKFFKDETLLPPEDLEL